MSSSYSVSLPGPAPWGFRLQGGKDFSMPLTVSKLTDGGKAALANIAVGDILLSIDGLTTTGMTHLEAQNKIKACTGNLSLTLQKSNASKPAPASKEEPLEIIKPVPVAHQPSTATTSSPTTSYAYNKTARPFGGANSTGASAFTSASKVASIPSASSAFTPASPASSVHAPPSQPQPPQPTQPQPPFPIGGSASRPTAPLSSAPKPSTGRTQFPVSASSAGTTASPSTPAAPQSSVYNTPINLYSNENACEVAMGQRRGLLEKHGVAEHLNGASRKPIDDPEPHLVQPHCDTSKKWLVEDQEDWNSRTGTSQSRSFRILAQMTGTESSKGQENDAVKHETVIETPLNVHHSSPVKTMTKVPAGGPQSSNSGSIAPFKAPSAQGKPSTWQTSHSAGSNLSKTAPHKGQVTPSFGQVSSSGAKGPVLDRPAPQPHPKDQNSLVQRAEHIPAGTRTPMCAQCNKVIRGPFLVAMGKSWHPEEFNCAHCHTSLGDVGFVEERGSVYCAHCYEQFFAPICARCQQKILGEVINALKQTWHVYCFLCASCQQPIRNNIFHLEDGEPYCERDYYNLFGTSCHGCDFPIEAGDKFLEALGFTWHDTCFVCAVCSTSLESQAFFSKKDKPLCKKHAHTVKI
ncbi:PDZ and LIM domain protein 5b isoform X1 [Scleropages formosus]|uniref:PDZ and LIM domain 5b n=2 Tax=Scleropages formosus TaxID=113540 RepID=A0A8C9SG50_SCLFO|nr:PDZ and LIM domain protein 5-like isoform X1 [Scleropages formosus]